MMDLLRSHWKDVLDVLILSFIFYYLFRFIRGTRAVQMVLGLLLILLASSVAGLLQLDGLNWIVQSLKTVWVLAFLIIFQPELRKALAGLGEARVFRSLGRGQDSSLLGELVRAAEALAEKRLGALIVVERSDNLKTVVETGTLLEAKATVELLVTIFTPPSPLHDGAVVVSGNQIQAAGCFLPLMQNPRLAQALGTRHRAALGMSDETDAVVVVVSEETGQISIAESGRLIRALDPGELRSHLGRLLLSEPEEESEPEGDEAAETQRSEATAQS
jgi:diadenylate cyclase